MQQKATLVIVTRYYFLLLLKFLYEFYLFSPLGYLLFYWQLGNDIPIHQNQRLGL